MSEWKNRVYTSYMSNGFKDGHSRRKEFELHNRYFKKNYLKYMPKDKNISILDLGCGMGQFLNFCWNQGYKNCIGIDVSSENVDFVKKQRWNNIKVYCSSITDFLDNKEQCFDVVVLNDVIEHLTKEEIFDVMDAVRKALRRDGVFFIKTPNMANPYVSTVGRYIDITHEIGFTEKSIRQVLKATGYNKIHIVGTDIYILNPIISTLAKVFSKIINIFLFILSALYGRTSIKIFEKDILAIAHKS